MTKKRRHNEKLSEDDAMQLVLKSHPEWRRQWERGTLPDEMLGEDGEPMSPLMHFQIHVVVESYR